MTTEPQGGNGLRFTEYSPGLSRRYLNAMKARIITTAGIAFCSLLITTIPTLGGSRSG
jgi:hypothetical protein